MDTRRTRKQNRLRNYDYGSDGSYFVTICTKERIPYFWTSGEIWLPPLPNAPVGAHSVRPPDDLPLSEYGTVVQEVIEEIGRNRPDIYVRNSIVMPNHVHLLIEISRSNGRTECAPTTLSNIIHFFKGTVTKRIGFNLWQKSFHDHIVKDRAEFEQINEYIDQNPGNWKTDCFYVEESGGNLCSND